jgi:hypothetical protein
MAILLACAYYRELCPKTPTLSIPKFTYIGVPQAILRAGCKFEYRDEQWKGGYEIMPTHIWDCARRFTSNMYEVPGRMLCVSFHHTKILGLAGHGGAILHDNLHADSWLRKARFDGRTEGIAPKDDDFQTPAWHCYMTPTVAAEGLMRLQTLPKHNEDLPWDEYPDLSVMTQLWM